MSFCPARLLVSLLLFLAANAAQQPMTRDEAAHIGLQYPEPPVVKEFKNSKLYLNSRDRHVNDFMLHHRIAEDFCKSREKQKCEWWEYYRILDDVLRVEFAKLYDPKLAHTLGQPLSDVIDGDIDGCLILHEEPSAEEFLQYVLQSRPVIIRSRSNSGTNIRSNKKQNSTNCEGQDHHSKKSTITSESLWTLKNLDSVVGSNSVVVSATPSSEFDGPEDPKLWGLTPRDIQRATSVEVNSKKLKTSYESGRSSSVGENHVPDLIVRPAHIQLTFNEYIQLLKNKNVTSSNFYLEYFPMVALFGNHLPKRGSALTKSVDVLQKKMIASLPQSRYANFLSQRYHLLWLSGGGSLKKEEEIISKTRRSKARKKTPDVTDVTPERQTTSRMHFDRMENLMTVVSGSKTFTLYPPDQSGNLHAGGPCISASLSATVVRNSSLADNSRSISDVQFTREKKNVNFNVNYHHTYAPVNVKSPDYKKFPKLQRAQGFECTVDAGDTLYLPAHWWHEVTSRSDNEGKCVGVNRFFEPVYIRPQYNSSLNYFQTSQYYGHVHISKRVQPCSDDYVCFLQDVGETECEASEHSMFVVDVNKERLHDTLGEKADNRKKRNERVSHRNRKGYWLSMTKPPSKKGKFWRRRGRISNT